MNHVFSARNPLTLREMVCLPLGAIGASMVMIGSTKMVQHASQSVDEFGAICGSSVSASVLNWFDPSVSHCWGCPVMLAGVIAVLVSILNMTEPS